MNAQGRAMMLGGIDAGWLIATPGSSGNNYLIFDNFRIALPGTNTAPIIGDIGNQTVNEDYSTSALTFSVADVETPAASLTVAGSSSNTALVPNANIVFGGSGANRTVTVTPAANQNGTATITVTVSDGARMASDTFVLTVSAVNDAPTIGDIANQTVNEDAATSTLAFTVGDAETAAVTLTVTGSSSNTTLVPNASIVFGGSGASRTVTVTPAANQSGAATITVTVSDGSLTASDTFVITVNPVNDAPTISDIASQATNEDTATSAVAFTVGDMETTVGSLTVTGNSSNVTLVPNANIVFGGSGANRTVTVTPAANQNGTATITVTVSDGALTASDTFAVTVNAVNDAPTISGIADQAVITGAVVGPLSFTVADVETAAGSLTVSGSSSNTTLVPNANVVLGGSGANRSVTVTPAANQNGTATITITVSDGALSSNVSFSVTVQVAAFATHAAVSGGYVPGSTVTISNSLNYTSTVSSLAWSVLLPTGWSFASGGGSEGDIRPSVGTTSVLDWNWTAIPASPVVFNYALNVPVGTTGDKVLQAIVSLVRSGQQLQVLAQPDPLSLRRLAFHSADYDRDGRIGLPELLRAIELYNYRAGTVRTGQYTMQAGTEDGFTPGPTGSALTRFHSADTVGASAGTLPDGKLNLAELLRVIELYNYRAGTVRTGQYRILAGTEDGFAPGP